MTSAAVLFYGRRSRSSSRTFDDLGFGSPVLPSPFSASSSSSSTSSDHTNTTVTANHRHRHHHHHHRKVGDLHRRHRHVNFDDHSPRSPIPGGESHQQGCNGDSSSWEINDRETVHDLSGRYHRNNMLPGSVLLAKERLVQRLRGVSVSGNRDNRETSPSLPSNHQLVVGAEWETDVSREEPAAYRNSPELPVGAHQPSAPREPQRKPLGLTKEALSQLQHDVFLEQQKPVTQPMSKASTDCSICLESFVEGNKLINLPCGHRFHSSCLYPWLQTCGECPYCRTCIMFTS
ncbi:probable E3 ubiquitin-protein ligase RHY1A isoform X1 [Chenopodium quinoa]|nr:probable E3 ubiquitin-protein ligase RHY1A isoform X1 [Chenopodium quinoa]